MSTASAAPPAPAPTARPSAFCADDERNLLRDIQKVTRQTIPTIDRRNDKALGAATAAAPSLPAESRGERPARGQRHQPGRKPARPSHQKSHEPHRDGAPGAAAKKHRNGKGSGGAHGQRNGAGKPKSGNGEQRYVAATTPWSPVK